MNMANMFLSTLSPKFYVALTGTSSLISGLILIFEWWYFRKYGTSFIEQVSLTHLSPWLGGAENGVEGGSGNNGSDGSDNGSSNGDGQPQTPECKMWRNPLNLFRGAEYQRFQSARNREPLTYYDMNLSAQDHQTFFTCDADSGKPEYEISSRRGGSGSRRRGSAWPGRRWRRVPTARPPTSSWPRRSPPPSSRSSAPSSRRCAWPRPTSGRRSSTATPTRRRSHSTDAT